EPDARFWESAVRRRRIVLATAAVLVAAVGVGYYMWSGRGAACPPPPPVPPELTDPPARAVVEGKRRAVMAAPRSRAARGERAVAFDAHESAAEAVACFPRAPELGPNDSRPPFPPAGPFDRCGARAAPCAAAQP